MSDRASQPSLKSEASELVLTPNQQLVCETYVFSPVAKEEGLGWFYAVGEIEDRGGIGQELLDMVIQAVQREYYRDHTRSPVASFEAALHQANLVLHDAAEQGVRDWMGHFHVVLSVLVDGTLHLSTAGDAGAYVVRRGRLTHLSADLAYSPVTNPLNTFSQVASGAVAARDIVLLGTAAFSKLFRKEDLARFAIEHSADTFRERLEQLHQDQRSEDSVAAVVISLLPEHIATKSARATSPEPPGNDRELPRKLTPREPLVVHRTTLQTMLILIPRLLAACWQWLRNAVLPVVSRGSKAGGKQVAAAATRGLKTIRSKSTAIRTERKPFNWRIIPAIPLALWHRIVAGFRGLPRTSKVFAVISLVLAVVLVISLVVLRYQRAEDMVIQQASESLHDARTKVAAAENALIYDDRDEARAFISEADSIVIDLIARDIYLDEARTLQHTIQEINDRLQRVVRSSTAEIRVLGDFKEQLSGAEPVQLELIENILYTFHPSTNSVYSMNVESGETSTVTEETTGIGFFTQAAVHPADKTIALLTDTPGIALFDSKDGSMSNQTVAFASAEPKILDLAVFGSRLYLYDQTADNIFSYNKSLRGFEGGGAWLQDADFPSSTIISLAVDGSIYTLHEGGTVRNIFKGEEVADFSLEPVDPPLTSATRLVTRDDLTNLYLLDPANKRVVVYTKEGELIQQVLIDVATSLTAFSVAADEDTLYVLDSTRVLAVPLS